MLEKEQPVVELETDKATIEVPSSVAGKVKEIKVKPGDKVKVGQAILSVDDNGAADTAPKQAAAKSAPAKAAAPKQAEGSPKPVAAQTAPANASATQPQ